MITRNFNLYLHKKGNPLVIQANQYDSGEQWVFTLLEEDGTQYIPTTGAIIGRKSDGNAITVGGSVVDGKVVIIETEQMTAAAGKAVFELSVDDLTHGTANFIVNVEKKPIDDAVISDSDLSLIQQALDANSGFKIVFTLTYDYDNDGWFGECDHTAPEIYEAIQNGERIDGTVMFTNFGYSYNERVVERKIIDYRLHVNSEYYWMDFFCAPTMEGNNSNYEIESMSMSMMQYMENTVYNIAVRGIDKLPNTLYVVVGFTYRNGVITDKYISETWQQITDHIRYYSASANIRYTNWDTYRRDCYPATVEWVQSSSDSVHFRSVIYDGQTLKEVHVELTNNDELSFEINTIGE